METNAFDIRSSLNLKAGTALLGKAPAGAPVQEVQPEGISLFAGMLEQKISEGALPDSAASPSTAVQGRKRPLPIAVKGMKTGSKGKPEADGKAKPTADLRPGFPLCGKEPIKCTATEGNPPAGPAETLAPPLTQETEPAEAAETAIPIAKERIVLAGILAADENDSQADPATVENDDRPIMLSRSTDTALFAQSFQFPDTDPLKKEAAIPLTGKLFEKETEPAATEELLRKESPAPGSHEPLPPSGHRADHRTALEESQRVAGPSFVPEAAEAVQRKNGETATNATLDLSREMSEASADTTTDPHRKTSEALTGATLDQRRAAPLAQKDGQRTVESKEGASITAAPQKPEQTVQGGEPVAERTTPAGSANKPLPAENIAAETATAARDRQQIRGTATRHSERQSDRDPFPFHIEMTNAASLQQEPGTPAAVGPLGVEMQEVIDQILEARQTLSSDSGRIRIILNPPNLGAVDLEIVVRGERVEVVMTAENATVQQALQSRGEDIRISLQRQDLKIEGFQVLLQENGTNQQQAHGGAMHGQDREHRERLGTVEEASPALSALSSAIPGRTSVEGRVSIFA